MCCGRIKREIKMCVSRLLLLDCRRLLFTNLVSLLFYKYLYASYAARKYILFPLIICVYVRYVSISRWVRDYCIQSPFHSRLVVRLFYATRTLNAINLGKNCMYSILLYCGKVNTMTIFAKRKENITSHLVPIQSPSVCDVAVAVSDARLLSSR